MSDPIVAARGLTKRFGAVVAADDVTLEIRPREILGVIGANGAGKTTFVNMVTGYLKPDEGTILFRGADITRLPPREVMRLGIRRSFQVAQLFPNLSVRDNILVALASAERKQPSVMAALRTPESIAQAGDILVRLGLEDAAERGTAELPQGRRKLLDIALAMVGHSAVLLLDEPTSGISAAEKFPLMDLILEAVAAEEAAILFVEHDMEIVERYAARVIAFYEGRVIADGTPPEVLADANVRRYVVGAELHRRAEGNTDVSEMLDIRRLSVAIAGTSVLNEVTLSVVPGSFAGLVGRNGAGKTTLMRAIMGLLPIRLGELTFLGQDLRATQPHQRAGLGIGYMPEDRRLIPELTVQENVLVPAWANNDQDAAQRLAFVYGILPEVQQLASRRALALSGGQQKLAALARALMCGRRLLLLDEPFEGIAPALARRLVEAISALRATGVSVLLSESDYVHSGDLIDRLYVIERGVVTERPRAPANPARG